MKIESKKLIKIIALMISSVIIASASAQVYKYMYIDGSVTIGTPALVWILGNDAPPDASITGSTVTIDLDVNPGEPINYTECLFLKNNSTNPHNLTIEVTTPVSSGTFNYFKVHIYENYSVPGSWSFVHTLDVTADGDSYSTYTNNNPLPAGGYYRLTFEIYAKEDASGSVPFDIQVTYE